MRGRGTKLGKALLKGLVRECFSVTALEARPFTFAWKESFRARGVLGRYSQWSLQGDATREALYVGHTRVQAVCLHVHMHA